MKALNIGGKYHANQIRRGAIPYKNDRTNQDDYSRGAS